MFDESVTPDIEQALNELAEKQGTIIELLALKALRERFFTAFYRIENHSVNQ